ncbi:MAG: prepilin peptidase CpaA [Alcanivorax sp.]|jgi:prepilin peptidase CpaA|uniref:A24 family peptidase n=1 Tax=Alcanivorax sp. TaxID=1872427 RepID=UPI0039E371FD
MVTLVLTLSLLMPAVYYDITERRIPNSLIAIFILVIPAVLFLVQGASVLPSHFAAAGIVFLSVFVFWLLGWLGAGDVKLLALVALIAGLSLVPELLLNTALCGLVLAVLAIVAKGAFRQTGKRLFAVVRGAPAGEMEQDGSQAKLPYAVAIAAGAVLTVSGVSPLP